MKFRTRKKTNSPRKTTVYTRLKNRTWDKCSLALRMSMARTVDGRAQCVTCGVWLPFRKLQAGHFIARAQGLAGLFEPNNIHCQCRYCNMLPETLVDGASVKERYTTFMTLKYGQLEIERLVRLVNDGREKFKIAELKKMMEHYEEIIAVEEERLIQLF